MVLQLETRSVIERIQIMVHNHLIPNAIEVQIGDVPETQHHGHGHHGGDHGHGHGHGHGEVRKAMFMSLGEVEWEYEKQKHFPGRQMQTVELGEKLKVTIDLETEIKL